MLCKSFYAETQINEMDILRSIKTKKPAQGRFLIIWRRGRDSNPGTVARRWFSSFIVCSLIYLILPLYTL